jgi:hypothetical protein
MILLIESFNEDPGLSRSDQQDNKSAITDTGN